MRASSFLSKSLFMRGRQCLKSLYLHKYHPDLRDEITPAQEAIFQTGHTVGRYAQNLFPGGVEIPYEGLSITQQLRQTAYAIQAGGRTLYEAAFQFNGVFVKVDILHRGEQGWELYEVKASGELKPEHVDDVAIQCYVVAGAGLPLTKASLVYINKEYVRRGDIDVAELFVVEDLTGTVSEIQDLIPDRINQMREMLRGEMPSIDIGPQCSDPYDCDFRGQCWKDIPEESIFSIRGRLPNRFELYREGIVQLQDIPRDILSASQLIQVEGTLEKKNVINREGLREFLSTLWFPLCFLDFETTYMMPIPLFDETRPYQQVPFQYSLHLSERENGELLHYEFLADPGTDPRRDLLESLLERIPDNACILCYNMAFEKGRLSDCKTWFPEHAEKIDTFIENIQDLMVPFRKKDVYQWQMNGSYSIKNVLPALIPEMSYEGMAINSGDMASSAWFAMAEMNDPEEREKKRRALLEYCKLDTLAMVKILEKLRTL
ncbi:MAG: DUF2779 domain-containing protein [Deltaproteobacteria bacterium]|nr:DUF2779 domain-containing protein [Deltaproteobacteria bacterium]